MYFIGGQGLLLSVKRKNREDRLCFLPHRVVSANGLKIAEQVLIERMAGKRGAVADDQEFAASAGQGDVGAPDVCEKTDVAFGIGAYQREYDGFFFAALKTVHAVDFQARNRQELAQ